MDKTKTILIILIVIVAVVAIAAIFGMGLTKTDTKITIMSNDSLSQDDQIKVDFHTQSGNIEGKTIHFKFIDEKGNVSEYSVDTDVNGKAKLNLKELDSGNYTVNVTFEGDDKYNSANATQKLEIKDAAVEEEPVHVESSTTSTQRGSEDDGISEYRDFISWDYAPGEHIRETTYKNGDIKHEYDDGSSDYYDSSAQEWRYKDADGREGSMYVGN